MSPNVGGLRIDLPPVNIERELARKIYASKSELRASILEALVARPKRYMELQRLLKGRNDKVLNDALRKLVAEGLLHQRSEGRARIYELSSLGVAVRDAIHEHQLLDRLAAELREGSAVEA